MDKRLVSIIFVFLSLGAFSQKKIQVSYDKHVILLLEDMSVVKPIENTCGVYYEGDLPIYNVQFDSIDNKHFRVQANLDQFQDCNFTLFCDKGILILEMIADNDTDELIQVIRPSDLSYTYDKEQQVSIKQSAAPVRNSDPPKADLHTVYDMIPGPDFNKKEVIDLVEFSLTNIAYYEDHLYFVIVANNPSSIDYHLGGVFFNQIINEGRGKGAQRNETYREVVSSLEPDDGIIKAGEYEVLCYKIEKFTLTKKNELEISIVENNGRRQTKIEIKNAFFHSNIRNL
ncbi:DUF4138 domain-containing protein [Ekhidna sp. MALMAid0563]|uniref:DUF4138 domain-containing protein n=1 Tax=Ekhidna sp. MALMAid0563 TaxID=3143937 RepID=UPI0032DFAD14